MFFGTVLFCHTPSFDNATNLLGTTKRGCPRWNRQSSIGSGRMLSTRHYDQCRVVHVSQYLFSATFESPLSPDGSRSKSSAKRPKYLTNWTVLCRYIKFVAFPDVILRNVADPAQYMPVELTAESAQSRLTSAGPSPAATPRVSDMGRALNTRQAVSKTGSEREMDVA